jgi:hypothetical protein
MLSVRFLDVSHDVYVGDGWVSPSPMAFGASAGASCRFYQKLEVAASVNVSLPARRLTNEADYFRIADNPERSEKKRFYSGVPANWILSGGPTAANALPTGTSTRNRYLRG